VIVHVGAVPVEELLPLACAGPLLWPALRALVRARGWCPVSVGPPERRRGSSLARRRAGHSVNPGRLRIALSRQAVPELTGCLEHLHRG